MFWQRCDKTCSSVKCSVHRDWIVVKPVRSSWRIYKESWAMRFNRWWTSATKYRTSTIFSSLNIIRKISSGKSRRWCFDISHKLSSLISSEAFKGVRLFSLPFIETVMIDTCHGSWPIESLCHWVCQPPVAQRTEKESMPDDGENLFKSDGRVYSSRSKIFLLLQVLIK